MIDYEEKRSETRHRMGFMIPLLVFVLAFVACCGVIACVFLRAAVISDEAARESAGIALCRSAAPAASDGRLLARTPSAARPGRSRIRRSETGWI